MLAPIHGIEAYGNIRKEDMMEIERIQGNALKRIFTTIQCCISRDIDRNRNMACRTENTVCNNPADQRMPYATFMLYHNIKNSDEERKIRKMIEEQEKKNCNNTFCKKVQQIHGTLQTETDKVTCKKKSTQKKK